MIRTYATFKTCEQIQGGKRAISQNQIKIQKKGKGIDEPTVYMYYKYVVYYC